jgi:hypothetical protein
MLKSTEALVQCDPSIFKANFNRLPHEVQHSLADHPLFQLPALAELAQRIASRKDPHHTGGDVDIHQGSTEKDAGPRAGLPDISKVDIAGLLEQIEKGQTWIILNHIEREPGYREIFENCICDLLGLAGKEVVKDIKWFNALLFITSPNRITAYHSDRECAWLLQIHGEKDFHLFDRGDKDVLPDEELERYWAGTRSVTYKPQYESRAMVYRLRPGIGVHTPANTPHWLQNGNNISVSLGINFQFHEHAWENLYKANYYLRRAGLTPSSPGERPLADCLKRGAYTAVQALKRKVRNQPGVPNNEAREHYHRIVELLASR